MDPFLTLSESKTSERLASRWLAHRLRGDHPHHPHHDHCDHPDHASSDPSVAPGSHRVWDKDIKSTLIREMISAPRALKKSLIKVHAGDNELISKTWKCSNCTPNFIYLHHTKNGFNFHFPVHRLVTSWRLRCINLNEMTEFLILHKI